MKKHLMVFGVLMLLIAPMFAQSVGPSWDYLRPAGTQTGKFLDSLMCYAVGDTSKIFYFNGLIPKGMIYMKIVDKVAVRDTLYLPRLEYQILTEPLGGGTGYAGKYGFKVNDSLALRNYGPGDSVMVQVMKPLQAWEKKTTEVHWNLFIDSTALITWTAADTALKALPYDVTALTPYGVRFRALTAGHVAAKCSTFVKQFYMTGTKPMTALRYTAP